MRVDGGKWYRTIWPKEDDPETNVIQIIDQRRLPHEFVIESLYTSDDVATAIKDMHVRGAGLIGAAGAYGMYLAAMEAQKSDDIDFNRYVKESAEKLKATRPTAVNLAWAVDRMYSEIHQGDGWKEKRRVAYIAANQIADEDSNCCERIGHHGMKIIEDISKKKNGETVNIGTHCNAGWLAFVDYGSALSPIYVAHDKGIKVNVYVDETAPRRQGSNLTAWELGQFGVPHKVISDNTAGLLMKKNKIDMFIVGTDRTTYTGDVANKIGTYLKALAAKDNNVPFYVALPSSTFDWNIRNGMDIPIEERGSDEVHYATGMCDDGVVRRVRLTPKGSEAVNYGFDITPAKYITGLITERGICPATEKGILDMYPEHRTSRPTLERYG